jgi:hypothetical protein
LKGLKTFNTALKKSKLHLLHPSIKNRNQLNPHIK